MTAEVGADVAVAAGIALAAETAAAAGIALVVEETVAVAAGIVTAVAGIALGAAVAETVVVVAAVDVQGKVPSAISPTNKDRGCPTKAISPPGPSGT